ncbi:MAG: GcrA family cell cycle regulator [Pseudomonadota bacterium]
MSWTDERIDTLRKLWADGLSASQIADTLGGGVSRNAVIGKIHRLGLSGRVKSNRSTTPRRPTPPRPKPAAQPRVMAVGSAVLKVVAREETAPEPEPAPEPAPTPEAHVAEVVPIHGGVSLFELKTSSCRWPLGDPSDNDFRFCGLKTGQGETYCKAHAEAAFPSRTKAKSKD